MVKSSFPPRSLSHLILELNKSSYQDQTLEETILDEEEELRRLRESYQKEAAEIHQKYISQIESFLNKKDEPKLEVEPPEDTKMQKLEREINEERRMRLDAERRNAELEDSLEKSQKRIQELELENKKLRQEHEQAATQSKELFSKIQMNVKEQTAKFKEQEEKHLLQIANFKDQLAKLEKEIGKMTTQHENELKQVMIQKDTETFQLDQEIKELNKLLEKKTAEHENEIKQLKLQIQEQESERMPTRAIETEEDPKSKENKEGSPPRENNSFYSEERKSQRVQSPPSTAKLTDRAKKFYNIGMTEKEIEKILLENRKLKTQLSEALKINEQLEHDSNSKDRSLKVLEDEATALHKDNARMRELHQQEIDKAVAAEKKNWEQTEKELRTKISQLEAGIGHAREESAKSKLEYEQLKELLQGNVNKIISQTFKEVGAST